MPNTNLSDSRNLVAQADTNDVAAEFSSVNTTLAASDCLLQYGHLLTPQEKSEILSYQEVYFVGPTKAKELRRA